MGTRGKRTARPRQLQCTRAHLHVPKLLPVPSGLHMCAAGAPWCILTFMVAPEVQVPKNSVRGQDRQGLPATPPSPGGCWLRVTRAGHLAPEVSAQCGTLRKPSLLAPARRHSRSWANGEGAQEFAHTPGLSHRMLGTAHTRLSLSGADPAPCSVTPNVGAGWRHTC